MFSCSLYISCRFCYHSLASGLSVGSLDLLQSLGTVCILPHNILTSATALCSPHGSKYPTQVSEWPSQTLHFPCANLQISIPFSISGEQGWPVLSTHAIGIGAAMGVTASINSIGCYLLCSKALKNPPPLRHSCNRGLCAEGLGSLLSAVLGSMSGTASSMSNACASSLTQVPVWIGVVGMLNAEISHGNP